MPRPPAPQPPAEADLSIGDLAEATGLGVETLRAWERRYGRPASHRRPSGHRRYDAALVPWLRLVAEAVALGRRPSAVVPLGASDLEDLLERLRPAPARPAADLAAALRRVECFDARGLSALLGRARRAAPSAAAFLDGALAPLLAEVGTLWAAGRLAIRHEHFATEALGDLLRRWRAARRARPKAPLALFATLPGEHHAIPLQMAALVAAEAGLRVRVLGVDTPVPEIASAAREAGARAVVVAVSLTTAGLSTEAALDALRDALPARAALVVGGAGARAPGRRREGVVRLDGFAAFEAWLAGLREPRP